MDNNTIEKKNTVVSSEEETIVFTSNFRGFLRRFCKNKLAVVGTIMLVAIVILCVGAPLFTSYDPISDMFLDQTMIRPFQQGRILGTDDYGRDLWSRLLYGGRTSVATGIAVAIITGTIGVIIGCVSGYFGGIVDTLLMRLTDIMISFPFMIVAICLLAALGSSQWNLVLALCVMGWAGFARLTRGQVLSIKNKEYVEAATVAGFGKLRIMFLHILPNCIGPIIIQMTLSVGNTILAAAGLNYLGLGVDAATPDWGVMLNQGKSLMTQAPYLTIIPGIAISLTVLSVNWIGDGLRDALDPKLRK